MPKSKSSLRTTLDKNEIAKKNSPTPTIAIGHDGIAPPIIKNQPIDEVDIMLALYGGKKKGDIIEWKVEEGRFDFNWKTGELKQV